uniref:Putative trypsin n=1 Tax=Anopheles darlingi TaxID=43151 RepID=A0A2M4DQQ7_ANODA
MMKQSVTPILLVLVLCSGYFALAQQENGSDLESDVESADSADAVEQNGTNQSGSNRVGRIYNGVPAASENQLYPALILAYSGSKLTRLVGMVFSDTWILTSASALGSAGTALTSVYVYVGNTPTINTTLVYTADTAYKYHINFNKTTLANDVGAVVINGSLVSDPRHLRTLSLATTEISVSTTNRTHCVVLGWGQLAGGTLNNTLAQADYELLTDQECSSAFNQTIPPSILCARSINGYACDMDGGAPLVCNGELYGILTAQTTCIPSSTAKTQKFAKIPIIFPPPATTPAPTTTTTPAPSSPSILPRKNYVSCS